MTRYVALLRGINVGGHRRIAMADLRAALAAHGFEHVRTHLQSGNVLLQSRGKEASVQRAVEAAIESELGIDVQVVVRSRDELAAVAAYDPHGQVADNPSRYLVVFLSKPLPAAAARTFEAIDDAGAPVVVHGREIYAWYPEGLQRATLSAMLAGGKLPVVATVRNWNTVTKLLAMADE